MNSDILLADPTVPLIILGIVALILSFYLGHLADKKLSTVWQRTAEQLDLSFVRDYELFGQIDDLQIAAFVYTQGSGKNAQTRTRVSVRGDRMSTVVRIRGEGFFSSFFSNDIVVGDPPFDNTVKLAGDEVAALALFDENTRRLVRGAVSSGWAYEGGVWVLDVGGRLSDALGHRINAGVDLAKVMTLREADMATRLASRAAHDSLVVIRKRALEHLIRHFGADPNTLHALDVACADSDPGIRLLAAAHQGNLEVLNALAQSGESVSQRVEAFEAMVRVAPHDEPVRNTVVQWLGFDQPEHRPLRIAAIDAAARVEVADIEARLLEVLGADDDETKLSTIHALGALGTVAVVPALIPYRDKVFAFALKGAAKDAILAIQARVMGADAGALALAADGGGLALATETKET